VAAAGQRDGVLTEVIVRGSAGLAEATLDVESLEPNVGHTVEGHRSAVEVLGLPARRLKDADALALIRSDHDRRPRRSRTRDRDRRWVVPRAHAEQVSGF